MLAQPSREPCSKWSTLGQGGETRSLWGGSSRSSVAGDGEEEEGEPHGGGRGRGAPSVFLRGGGQLHAADPSRRSVRAAGAGAGGAGAVLGAAPPADVRRLRSSAALDGDHPPHSPFRVVPQHLVQRSRLLGAGLPAAHRLPELRSRAPLPPTLRPGFRRPLPLARLRILQVVSAPPFTIFPPASSPFSPCIPYSSMFIVSYC